MSKQKKPKRRKRKTGYFNCPKATPWSVEFHSFKDFAAWAAERMKNAN